MASRRKSSKEITPIAPEKPRRGRPRKAEQAPEYELTAKGKEVVSGLNGHPSILSNGHGNGATSGHKSTVLSGPIRSGHELYFTPQDRLLYENKQLEVRNGLQAIGIKKLGIAQAKSNFESQLRALDQQLATLTADAKRREDELRALQTEIADTYAVDLQKIAYDPQSGRITAAVS